METSWRLATRRALLALGAGAAVSAAAAAAGREAVDESDDRVYGDLGYYCQEITRVQALGFRGLGFRA